MKIKAGKLKQPGKTVKELTIAAGGAMKNGFYIEAVWLLSAIMEARLKKLLIVSEGHSPGAASGLEQHLKRIKLLQSREHFSVLKEQFPAALITALRDWKNNRNVMMKDMLEMHVSIERRERLARQGIELLKQLNKVYKHYKVAFFTPPQPPAEIALPVSENTVIPAAENDSKPAKPE